MSAAVRPMALAPDEQHVYFQVSFFHGFVEYDLVDDRVLRRREPAAERDDGAARGVRARLRPPRPRDGPRRREAVRRGDDGRLRGDRVAGDVRLHSWSRSAEKPYWATNSGDGRYCFVSVSGADAVSVISYRTGAEVARVPVGDHPQRMRMGKIRRSYLR